MLELPEGTLAERIRKGRLALRLSQAELAAELGVKAQSVSAWETGISRPSLDVLQKICKLYRVSLDWLIAGPVPVAKEAV